MGLKNELTESTSNEPDEGVTLALSVEDARWTVQCADLERLIAETLNHAARHLGFLDGVTSEMSVTLTDDASVREINRQWRGKDQPTNVLSFPMTDLQPEDRPGPLLGDLILAFETCRREAEAETKPFVNHARHLLVHGFLHCLGYDHIENDDAETMEALEIAILAGLEIPDPYDIADANMSGDNHVGREAIQNEPQTAGSFADNNTTHEINER